MQLKLENFFISTFHEYEYLEENNFFLQETHCELKFLCCALKI